MDGMSTQDLLNGQDLSTANVDDLLAAMKQEESSGEPAPVQEEAPKPKRGRPKKEAEPIPDLPDLAAHDPDPDLKPDPNPTAVSVPAPGT